MARTTTPIGLRTTPSGLRTTPSATPTELVQLLDTPAATCIAHGLREGIATTDTLDVLLTGREMHVGTRGEFATMPNMTCSVPGPAAGMWWSTAVRELFTVAIARGPDTAHMVTCVSPSPSGNMALYSTGDCGSWVTTVSEDAHAPGPIDHT